MYSKLSAIVLVLVLANVVNYGFNEWLDKRIPGWTPPVAELDGSSLSSSLAYKQAASSVAAFPEPFSSLVFAYYGYLEKGGENWLNWRAEYDRSYIGIIRGSVDQTDQNWRAQTMRVYDRTGLSKWGSLVLLILTSLLFFGGFLKEQHLTTAIYYLFVVLATAALYTAFSAPFFTGLVGGGFFLYALMLRLTLPIYTYEWIKSLRPFLTFIFFLLLFMSFRGGEWLDYLFWTSPLYRLGYLTMLLLTLLFHWSLLGKMLTNAKLNLTGRLFGYAVPLGVTALVLGLTLGFFNLAGANALVTLNQELLLFSPNVVAAFDASRAFILFFAGVILLISGGIGYSIQRIAG